MAGPYAARRRGPSRLRRALRRVVTIALVVAITVPVVIAAFVGTRCYGGQLYAGHAPGPPGLARYLRAEAFTFLTLPEWYIVFSTDEYAQFIRRSPPSAFPYLAAIGQYWGAYGAACDATRGRYPFEFGYHVMLGVIGVSLTAEYGVKAVYENTVGRLTEWLFSTDTPEDVFAAAVATEYGRFMHTTPWYQFPFADRLRDLWSDVPWWGPRAVRKWERRMALSLELGVKAGYGAVMGMGSQAAYGAEDLTTYGRILSVNQAAVRAAGGRIVPSRIPCRWSRCRATRRSRRRRWPCSGAASASVTSPATTTSSSACAWRPTPRCRCRPGPAWCCASRFSPCRAATASPWPCRWCGCTRPWRRGRGRERSSTSMTTEQGTGNREQGTAKRR